MLALILLPLLAGVLLFGNFGSGGNDDDDDDNDREPPVRLTEDGDTYTGTDGDDRVFGLGGHDTLTGGDGADALHGDGGNDFLRGLDGDDTLYGGAGEDALAGGLGDDHLFMGDGNDTTVPQVGGEQTQGDDLIRGGAGDDAIADTVGANTLFGDIGHDVLIGIDRGGYGVPGPRDSLIAADTLYGGYGNDALAGDEGDTMTGGTGRDLFGIEVWRDDAAAVRITDLADDEVLVLDDIRGGAHGEAETRLADNGNDLEVVIDGHVVAVLEGRTSIGDWQIQSSDDMGFGARRNFIVGTGGDDSLHSVHTYSHARVYGLDGNDEIEGSSSEDLLFGGDGDDSLSGENGRDRLDGGDGDDTLVGGYGVDTFFGGAGDDLLDGRDIGYALAETLHGGAGDDRLLGDGGDALWGADGADIFGRDFHPGDHAKGGVVSVADFDPANDRLEIDLGREVTNIGVAFEADSTGNTLVMVDGEVMFRLMGVEPDEVSADMVTLIRGNVGADETLTGTEGDDTLHGWAGNDSILGLDGQDVIFAGDGDDTVDPGIGHDTVSLGDGNDTYVEPWENDDGGPPDNDLVHGGNGDDSITASGGRDVLYGDLGDDTLSAVRHGSGAEGDNGADTLFGGFGRDELIGNNGDTLIGGDGIDSFAVYNDYDGDLVVIDDLQPGEQIRILWQGAGENEVPSFVIAPNGQDTIISNSVIVKGRVDFANFEVVIGPLHP